ncbi:BlaI/MecI/CopY family transcriptional regulator [Singulisphaera rosea]
MSKPETPRPSEAELAILQVLWERGPSTVREVYERVGKARNTGYTTVLKLMQIMVTKGLVERDEAHKSHVYRAQPSRTATQRRLVLDLIERAFGGSGRDLVLQALSARPASPEELAEIRSLLDQIEGESDEPDPGNNAGMV